MDGVGVEGGKYTSERNRLTDKERVDECEKTEGDNDTKVKAREEKPGMHKDKKEHFRSLGREKEAEANAMSRERRKRQNKKMNDDEEEEESADEEVDRLDICQKKITQPDFQAKKFTH